MFTFRSLHELIYLDNLFLVNSYQAIINNIAKAVKTHAKIHFETAVQRIMSQQHRQQNKRISVTTTNGNFDFDEVVVTVPLGCLKAGSIRFSPALSSNIIRGIADASYGHLEKALVVFPTAFWEDSHPGTVDGSPDVPVTGPSFPVFANFLHPTYAPSEQQSWNIQMLAFSSPTIFGIDAKPVLQFYLWGASATHMASAVANLGPTTPEYYETIVRLLRPFYSRLPNYEQASSKCTPIEVFATKWQYDDLAGRGSYTNFRIPEDGRCPEDDPVVDKGVRAMRQGMPDAGIWFAGEHTAPFVALGTTTGAYWSGESVAMRIIKAYGRPEDQKELN